MTNSHENFTEGLGCGTGFPTIYDAIEDNGSPKPIFETDDDCTYFLVTLPAHKLASGNQVTNGDKELVFKDLEDVVSFANQATNQAANQAEAVINEEVHERVADILNVLAGWKKRAEMFEQVGLSNQSFNREKYLDPLIVLGWVTIEFPEKRTSPNQRYRITETGKNVLNLLEGK